MKKIALGACALLCLLWPSLLASQTSLGWPDTIDRLTRERVWAETCVGLIKSGDNQAAIVSAREAYGLAKADMDGVIAALETALAEGGKPETLPAVRDKLESSGKALTQICDAVKTTEPNARGVRDQIARGAEPQLRLSIRAKGRSSALRN